MNSCSYGKWRAHDLSALRARNAGVEKDTYSRGGNAADLSKVSETERGGVAMNMRKIRKYNGRYDEPNALDAHGKTIRIGDTVHRLSTRAVRKKIPNGRVLRALKTFTVRDINPHIGLCRIRASGYGVPSHELVKE